jgi:uncharacterized membrane protein
MGTLLFALTLVAALGCGLIAGVLFAFSSSVMKALARLPAKEGMAAMQSINVAIINPWFLTVFLGTALACVLVIIFGLLHWHESQSISLLVGSALYLAGTFLMTMLLHVPKNNALARVSPDDADAPKIWASYLAVWLRWNHVRTAAALAAASLLTIALC